MHIIVQSSIQTLNKSASLLNRLTDEQLGNHSVPPYFSCIGSHIRHVLDFYDCLLDGLVNESVDLTNRKRDLKMHVCCDYAIENIDRIVKRLEAITDFDINRTIEVYDDLGLGKTKIKYTYAALLAQANSHAIHHYAIISYILDRLRITIEDENFGYNPTTPKPEINLN